MTESALRALPQAAIALGAHGVDHVRWTNLPRPPARTGGGGERVLDAVAGAPVAARDRVPRRSTRRARGRRRRRGRGFGLGFGLLSTEPGVPPHLGIRRRIAQDLTPCGSTSSCTMLEEVR